MPYRSIHEPLDIPDVDVWELIYENPKQTFPDDQVVLIDGETGASLTFEQHREQSKCFGQGMLSRWNWKTGDVLVLLSHNQIDCASITAGTTYAGGTFVAAAPTLTVEQLAYLLKDCGARALVTHPAYLQLAADAAAKAGLDAEKLVVVTKEAVNGIHSWVDIAAPLPSPTLVERPRAKATDTAYIGYTSGTTGTPKAVKRSHRASVYDILACGWMSSGVEEGWKTELSILIIPLYFAYSFLVRNAFLWGGYKLVIMNTFTLPKFLELAQDYKATQLFLSPPLIKLLGHHPAVDDYDLSRVNLVTTSGSIQDAQDIERLSVRLGVFVRNGYGLSECSAIAQNSHRDPRQVSGSVGTLGPNIEIKILERNGKEAPEGRAGRLWVKSPSITLGYHGMPEKTATLFDEDGFMSTGDIAVYKTPFLFIHERATDLIQYQDVEMRPSQIETVIKLHPQVEDAVIVGVPGEHGEQADPRAYIILKSGTAKTEKIKSQIIDLVASKTEEPFWLRGGVLFVDSIPQSPGGKILRSTLKNYP